jgi:hypothetical protein
MKLAHLLPSSMRSLLTPMASAIWRCNQPRCMRSQAWRRRASFPLRATGSCMGVYHRACLT